MKRRLEALLSARIERWESLRDGICSQFYVIFEKKILKFFCFFLESATRMSELAAYFGGERALTRVKKSDSLKEWFSDLVCK